MQKRDTAKAVSLLERVTAKVTVQRHPLYKGVGPILTALTVAPASAAEREVATF